MVLAGAELIFLIEAGMGLCFRLAGNSVDNVRMFSPLLSSAHRQGLFCSSHHPANQKAGGAQGVGRGHCWDSWPALNKGIFHTIRCQAQHIKLGEENGEMFRVMAFVLRSQEYTWWSTALLENLPVHGKWWMNPFLGFVSMHNFCFTY